MTSSPSPANELAFTIGYSQRFNPKFAYVKRSLEDGTIGEPVSALVSRHITRNLGKKISGRVKLSPAAMEATHDIDFVLWCLAPRKPIRVYAQEVKKIMQAQYNAPDCVWMVVTMDDGTVFTIGAGWVCRRRTELLVHVDRVRRDRGRRHGRRHAPRRLRLLDERRHQVPTVVDAGEKVNHVYAGPMEAETLHFLDCVATGKQPLVTAEHARMVMQLYTAADESAETNRPVDVTIVDLPKLAMTSA